jgi:hypothetical protein
MNQPCLPEHFEIPATKAEAPYRFVRATDPLRVLIWGGFFAAIVSFWIVVAWGTFGLL